MWRGAAGAVALAAWSIAGVFGAFLALLPVALERGPRGRAVPARPQRGVLQLGSPHAPAIADVDADERMEAARAAGEAFPG